MGLLSIIARLGLNTSGFETGMKRAESLAQKTGNSITGSLKGHLAAAFGVYAIANAAKETIKFASEMFDLAAATATTTDRMQELNYAATQNSATAQDMAKAMKNLAEAREDALKNPGGDKAQAFAAFGVGPAELATLKDMGELLLRVGDGVKGVNLDANSLPQILSLVGEKNMVVLPAMKEGLREAGDEARRLNLILGTDTVAALDAIGDAQNRLTLGLRKPLAELTLAFSRLLLDLSTLGLMLPSVGTLIVSGFMLPFAKAFEFIDAGFDRLFGIKSDGFFTREREKIERDLEAATDRIAQLTAGHNLALDPAGKKPKKPSLDAPEAKAGESAELRKETAEATKLNALYANILDLNTATRRVSMNSAGVLKDMTKDLERQTQYRDEMAEQDVDAVTLMEQDKTIAQLKLDIAQQQKRLEEEDKNKLGRSQATPMQFDSLARIGGLGVNADNGAAIRSPLERIARATEATVKAVEATGGGIGL